MPVSLVGYKPTGTTVGLLELCSIDDYMYVGYKFALYKGGRIVGQLHPLEIPGIVLDAYVAGYIVVRITHNKTAQIHNEEWC